MDHAPETRLARAAFTNTNRLADLLAELEGADWAMIFPGEAELLRAVTALTGARFLRVEPRLPLAGRAAGAAGIEVASFDADWRDSLVWLFEPDERHAKRAQKADATLLVDATFTPGSGFLRRGAQFVTYRNAATLTGHADVPFAALLGVGAAPTMEADALGALAEVLVRRDLATLPLRLDRQARTTRELVNRLGERATYVAGSVLRVQGELPGTRLFSERAPLGGVSAARLPLEDGVLLSAGLESIEDLWQDLTGQPAPVADVVDEPTLELLEPQPEDVTAQTDEHADEYVDEHAGASVEPVAILPPDLPEALVTSAEGTDPTEGLTQAQLAAFERLREWRNAEARRQEVSRFIIASNATLAEIARRAPQSLEELRGVKGMGPERIRKYSETILNMVRGLEGQD